MSYIAPYPSETKEFARTLYLQGVSLREISVEIGCDKTTVLVWCKDILKSHNASFLKGYVPWNKGKKWKPEYIEFFRDLHSGSNNHFWGKSHSVISKEKMSLAKMGKVGSQANNWQGGKYGFHKDKLRELGGCLSKQDWIKIKSKYGFMCLCCKKTEPEIILSMDHIIPVTKWETYILFHPEIKYKCNDKENIQPLCKSCNSKKSVKIIDYRNEQLYVK